VIHGCEYQSAEFWVQFAFRGGSTRRDSWKVIDFAPERAVSSIVEMASVNATVGDEQGDGVLRTFVDFADVFEFADGYREMDYGALLHLGNVATASAKAITNAAVSACRPGNNVEALAWAFSDLEGVKNKVVVHNTLNESGTNGNSNVQGSGSQGGADEHKKILRETLLKVKAAVERIDDVVVSGYLRGVHLSTLPALLSYERFERVTGCHPDLFQTAIDSGWINEKVVSNSVTQVHLILDAQLSPVM
jgi:hypothetical protein